MEREPRVVGELLPAVDISEMRLPIPDEELRVVEPGWVTEPQYADGIYLGGAERDGVLEFTALADTGEVLWSAQRPASCAGFVVTTDGAGRALAVLTDTETTGEALAAVTATAYELATGRRVWGPVEVSGPHQGPGLVFAAPPAGMMGETGPRTALDPGTGRVAVAETASGEVRLVGEYGGVVLTVESDALVARATADDSELWRVELADHGWGSSAVSASPEAPPAPGLVILTVSDPADARGVLIDLGSGAVLSESVTEVAVDATSGALVTLDGATLQAFDRDREALWSQTVAPGTTIAALGGVLLYLREGDVLRVHNVITGAVAEAYDPGREGAIVVPWQIAPNGASVLVHDRGYLVATVYEPEGAGDAGL
ncbi:hypothetical protein EDD28_0885 [Salana multivorans]|uniref:Pyrroloquinoline-quinone binding quinoprotein n=1 Tax=Salana multivorans TaxID=120377 RepID=A0A3N2D9E7_9MICO|nr:hypothetical protein EDD28_0885 [Salana multivorans]